MSAAAVEDSLKVEKCLASSDTTTPENEKYEEGAKDVAPDEAKPRPERTATFNDYLVCFPPLLR
ncbi:hypothetical protein E5D57_004892 [Metarhizium anisopliae]|nr:hypothetical protein E5D57_004892 [Metarhizium anisopliae]